MADFPTLTIEPEYPLNEEVEDATIRSSFEGGYQLTRPRHTRERGSWMLKYTWLPTTDKDTLKAFVSTVRSGADSFNWTNPQDAQVYVVRFTEVPKYSYVEFGYWNVAFKLTEV